MAVPHGKDSRGSKKWNEGESKKQERQNRRDDAERVRVSQADLLRRADRRVKEGTQQARKTEADKDGASESTELPARWTVQVSNAVSGQDLGQYLMAPTDLVQDLKSKICSRVCPARPWAVNGQVLRESQVLPEAYALKEAGVGDGSELQFVSLSPMQNIADMGRSEPLLLPDVIQQALDQCKFKAYQPQVEWVLGNFTVRESQAELEQDWKRACEEEHVVCEDLTSEGRSDPWLQIRDGHLGALRDDLFVMACKHEKGILQFDYFGFNDGFLPPDTPPQGWQAKDSHGDLRGRRAAPLLSPAAVRVGPNHFVSCFTASTQSLALPCSILALKSEGLEVVEVVSAGSLHGSALRVGFDLLLAVQSVKTLKVGLVAVFFHPLMTHAATTVDASSKEFSQRHFDHMLFMDLLDASACQHVDQVLVMWHVDLVRTLMFTLSPVALAFRNFRKQLAKLWLPDCETRIQSFNQLLQHELVTEAPLEPLLMELPKTVCANPSCPAGTDCAKHEHLFHRSIAPLCPGGAMCPRNATGARRRPCRRHHCRGPPAAIPRCNCVRLWCPTATGDRWLAKAKAKAKSKSKGYAGSEHEDAGMGGLAGLRKILDSIKTSTA